MEDNDRLKLAVIIMALIIAILLFHEPWPPLSEIIPEIVGGALGTIIVGVAFWTTIAVAIAIILLTIKLVKQAIKQVRGV